MGSISEHKSAIYLRSQIATSRLGIWSQIATSYSNLHFLQITRIQIFPLWKVLNTQLVPKMELVRIGAKNAIVELSRNPEQLLGDIAPRVRPAGVTLSRSQFATLKTHQYWISQIATSIFTKALHRGITE